jgi:hypothetical protein
MTTVTWTSTPQHSSDANFRAWGSDVRTRLAAAGLVQTADTGQIDWTTAVRGSNNTDAGYEIWRFNDSLQGTFPIFFKLFYGTGAAADRPRLRLQVGTGSNGSGTLTGRTSAAVTTTGSSGAFQNTPTQNYATHSEGMAALAFGQFNATSNMAFFVIQRSVDSDGDPTGDYYCVTSRNGSTQPTPASTQTCRVDINNNGLVEFTACIVPGIPASSIIGSDSRAYLHWADRPAIEPLIGSCTVNTNDITGPTTVSIQLFGLAARTYLVDARFPQGQPDTTATNATAYKHAILWE